MNDLYLDNDIVAKLASCNLLDDAVAVLDSELQRVRILSTFKYRYGLKNDRLRIRRERELGAITLGRLVAFQAAVLEVPTAKPEVFREFEDVAGIDAGEAQLYAVASEEPRVLVVTGDKRSLRSLATDPRAVDVARKLSGRVVCLEQVVEAVIDRSGFDSVKRRVVPALGCDTALAAAFGSGLDAEESQVRRALAAYINELRCDSGALLRGPLE